MRSADDVLQFWFLDHGQPDWFGGKPEFDAELATEFGDTQPQVARGEAWAWRHTPQGRLAEIIVLDQFSRQLHRGSPQAFAQDKMALVLAQEAIAAGADRAIEEVRRPFLYLPFIHAESLVIQDEGVRLFETLGDSEQTDYARRHRAVIQRFSRFPFRNEALKRESTAKEEAYMAERGDKEF